MTDQAGSPAARAASFRLAGAGAAAVLLAAASLTAADPDLWGHLRFGLDMLRDRGLTAVDPYSFTQDRPWVNHEWLAELQMGVAWSIAGTAGLAALKGLLVFATAVVVWRALAGVDLPVRLVALLVAAIGTTHITQSLRPQVWSMCFAAVLCRTLVSGSPRARWALPALFAIWANVHGGWLVGAMILGGWAAGDAIADRRRAPWWAALGLACLLATLANPYGTGLWEFLATTVRVGRPMIEEWQPLYTLPWPKWLPWVAVVVAAAWALRTPFVGRLQAVLPLAGLAYGSLQVARVLPFFTIAAVIVLAPRLRDRWPQRELRAARSPAEERIAALVLLAVGLAAASAIGARALGCISVDARMAEREPVRLLSDAPPGRLATSFDWGQYAIWHLGPSITVSTDGRRETVYSDARLDEHDAVLFGRDDAARVLDAWQPDYLWLPSWSRAAKTWAAGRGYRLELDTARSFVAVRPDMPPLAMPLPAEGGRRCFPE